MTSLAQFDINPNTTSIVHSLCSEKIATLACAVDVRHVVTLAERHVCPVPALLASTTEVKALTSRVVGFLDGAQTDSTDAEYLRGMVELICDTAGIDTDRRIDVAVFLWDKADTFGPVPHAVHTW